MDLRAIFKAYDIRGVYPEEIDEEAARRIGSAFATFAGEPSVLVGRDMRLSSGPLAQAFIDGVTAMGTDALDIGLCSTDMVYFAAGSRSMPGAMFTASHNPARYNGIKLCRAGAGPVGQDTGLADIRALAESGLPPGPDRGSVGSDDLLPGFVDHLLALVDVDRMQPLVVAVDAANGMGGRIVPAVFEHLPHKLVPLYFELDGSFPNHPADPIQPENLIDLQNAVRGHGANIGLAFDGDADRVFLVDENAEPVSGSLLTALIAQRLLREHPGAPIVYSVICSRVVPEVIRESGGVPVPSRVGHSFVKGLMAETEAVFGGEHSGHYYFRDNYRADSGMLAALYVLETMCAEGRPLSELLAPFRRYAASGEINRRVDDPPGVLELIEAAFPDAKLDRTDGLTVAYDDWWFNVRPSNTEPLLRLNVEASDDDTLRAQTERILELIGGT